MGRFLPRGGGVEGEVHELSSGTAKNGAAFIRLTLLTAHEVAHLYHLAESYGFARSARSSFHAWSIRSARREACEPARASAPNARSRTSFAAATCPMELLELSKIPIRVCTASGAASTSSQDDTSELQAPRSPLFPYTTLFRSSYGFARSARSSFHAWSIRSARRDASKPVRASTPNARSRTSFAAATCATELLELSMIPIRVCTASGAAST